MTVNTQQFTRPCDASPDCRHPICGLCGEPTRNSNQPSPQHPGAWKRRRGGHCNDCFITKQPLTAEDLQDQRHIILSDQEMAHVWDVDPLHHDFLMRRRYRLKIGEAAA